MQRLLHSRSGHRNTDTVEVSDDQQKGQEAQHTIAVFRRQPLPIGRPYPLTNRSRCPPLSEDISYDPSLVPAASGMGSSRASLLDQGPIR